MSEILSLVLGSMQADLARLDRVAMNLANAQTPGYKREFAASLPFAARLAAAGAGRQASAAADPQPTGLALHVDQRAGTLKPTGQHLDLALAGPGWFEVATEHGTAYTRQGNFRLDARGRLVTQQGHPVLGTAGEIQLLQGAPVIDASGRVFEGSLSGPPPAGAAPVAQLRIVRFDPAAPVERLGEGLVAVRGEPVLAAEGAVEVRQGFLENSNVSQMQEMVQLLQSVRHLEAMQKVATGYDEMLGTSIRRLGEAN